MDFEIKYRAGSEVNSVVLAASDEKAAGKAFSASHQGISADDVISVRDLRTAYHSDYGAAKFIGRLISFGGWIVVALGLLGILLGIFGWLGAFTYARELGLNAIFIRAISVLAVMLSLLYALIGLFMAAVGQHFRATVDTANYNGEMLALMKLGRA